MSVTPSPDVTEKDDEPSGINRFKSFAILDLETANIPEYNFNKVGITELSVYGFTVDELEKAERMKVVKTAEQELTGYAQKPKTPRVLHKLTLMLNPRMMIHPIAEKLTGLDNFMLQYESSFDENAASIFLRFLQHLQQPVCLVAHNGYAFDFRIIKDALHKLDIELPSETLCLDSFFAFFEIDEARKLLPLRTPSPLTVTTESPPPENDQTEDQVKEIDGNDFRLQNESTPKRPTKPLEDQPKRRRLMMDSPVTPSDCHTVEEKSSSVKMKSRRALFTQEINSQGGGRQRFRKWPKRGMYTLGGIHERIFGQPLTKAHSAEGDVEGLMFLILHYGDDFITYAQERAMPFAEIKAVGASN